MVGNDIPQVDIDEYVRRYNEWVLEGSAADKPKKFNRDQETQDKLGLSQRCNFFQDGEHNLLDGQLHRGKCLDRNSVDFDKCRDTYAKTNDVGQQEVQKYIFRQCVHEERTGVPNKTLARLKNVKNPASDRGKKEIHKILTPLLYHRFDIAPAKFMSEGSKGKWDFALLIKVADAYVQLYKDQPTVSDDSQALVLQVKHHDDLLNLIIKHCDKEFDKQQDTNAAIKSKIKSLERGVDSHYENLSRRINDEGTRIDKLTEDMGRLKVQNEESIAQLQAQIKCMKSSQSSADWKEQTPASTKALMNFTFENPTNQKNDTLMERYVRVRDFVRLAPGEWLNDEIINDFFGLLSIRDESCSFFKSHFITKLLCRQSGGLEDKYKYANVRRWTKNVDIFGKKLVFIPVRQNLTHWVLIVINMHSKLIQLYDSMGNDEPELLGHILHYIKDEHQDKKNGQLLPDGWKVIGMQSETIPCQTNGFDCGVFCCMYSYLLSMGRDPSDVTAADIESHGRHFIGFSILEGELDKTVNQQG